MHFILKIRSAYQNSTVAASHIKKYPVKNFIFNKLKGVTLLITSHDLEIAKKCDREFVFENGILIINKMNNQ